MGCQSEVTLGENLTFSVTTHSVATGVLTDSDGVPIYRIYEDETGTPILTGSMAKLDDPGTVGFYSELIQVIPSNGFEGGKTYTIYVEATVATVVGGISFAFRVLAATTDTAGAKTLIDSLTMVESVGVDITYPLGDTIIISEVLNQGQHLTLTDGVGLTEIAPVRATNPTLEDEVTPVDTIAHSIKMTLVDSMGLAEPQSQHIDRPLVDTIALVETVVKAIEKTLTDVITLNEVVSGPPRTKLDLRSTFRQHLSLSSSFRTHTSLSSSFKGGGE